MYWWLKFRLNIYLKFHEEKISNLLKVLKGSTWTSRCFSRKKCIDGWNLGWIYTWNFTKKRLAICWRYWRAALEQADVSVEKNDSWSSRPCWAVLEATVSTLETIVSTGLYEVFLDAERKLTNGIFWTK